MTDARSIENIVLFVDVGHFWNLSSMVPRRLMNMVPSDKLEGTW